MIPLHPEALKISGTVYPVNTDFRTWVGFEMLMLDSSVTAEAKNNHTLNLLFPGIKPPFSQETMRVILAFWTYGRHTHVEEKSDNPERIYDFKFDRQRIQAAFMAVFGFDPWALTHMHWWDFSAYFRHLLGATFENAVRARSLDLAEYKGKQRKDMQAVKDANKIWTKREIVSAKKKKQEATGFAEAYKSGKLFDFLSELKETT